MPAGSLTISSIRRRPPQTGPARTSTAKGVDRTVLSENLGRERLSQAKRAARHPRRSNRHESLGEYRRQFVRRAWTKVFDSFLPRRGRPSLIWDAAPAIRPPIEGSCARRWWTRPCAREGQPPRRGPAAPDLTATPSSTSSSTSSASLRVAAERAASSSKSAAGGLALS